MAWHGMAWHGMAWHDARASHASNAAAHASHAALQTLFLAITLAAFEQSYA